MPLFAVLLVIAVISEIGAFLEVQVQDSFSGSWGDVTWGDLVRACDRFAFFAAFSEYSLCLGQSD